MFDNAMGMQSITMKKKLTSILLFALSFTTQAQVLSVEEAIDFALKNNPHVRAASSTVDAQRQLKRTSFDLPKTDVTFMRGQYNSYSKDDNNISIVQSIPFAALGSQGALNRANHRAAELNQLLTSNELVYQVKQLYYELSYLKTRRKILMQQDSLFEGFYKSASLRFKTGETNLLEQTTADAERNESRNAIFQIEADIIVFREQLKALLNANGLPDIKEDDLKTIPFTLIADSLLIESNPALAISRHHVIVAEAGKKVATARLAPDLLFGYFNQTLIGAVDPVSGALATKTDRFSGFQIGLSLPLWFAPHQARVKSAKFAVAASQSEYEYEKLQTQAKFQQAIREYEKNRRSLEYYETTGLPNAQLIIKQVKTAFREGEANYVQYLMGIKNATQIRENYLRTLNNYNQTIIFLQFLTGNK